MVRNHLFFCYLIFGYLILQDACVSGIETPGNLDKPRDFNEMDPVMADANEVEIVNTRVNPLRVDNSSVFRLAELMATNQNFIFLKLNFANIVWDDPYLAYLNEEDYISYIDPLTFSFVRPGYGYLLMSLPFDFISSSLQSLQFAVSTIELTIDLTFPNRFLELSDGEQLDTVYQLLEIGISEADQINRGQPTIRLEEFALCLEHLDNYKGARGVFRSVAAALIINRYTLLQSVSDCHMYNDAAEGPPENYWLNDHMPLIFSFLIFVFAPLGLLLFLRMDPPPFLDEQGVLRMQLNLPVGFNHMLVSSNVENRFLKGAKVLIGVSLLMFLSYLQPIVAYLTNPEDFTYRVFAMERADLTSYWVFLGTVTTYLIIFLIMFIAYLVRIVLKDCDGTSWESDATRQCLTGWELPKELWVPAPSATLPFTQTVLYYARFRMQMALDSRLWKHEYGRLWKWGTSMLGCRLTEEGRYILGALIYLLMFIPFTILFLLRLAFNSLPVFYITKQCLLYIYKIPFGAMFLVIASLRLPAIIWYFITIFQCTFTGFVIHHEVVIPGFTITAAILIFFMNNLRRVLEEYTSLAKEITREVACLKIGKKPSSSTKHRDIENRQNRLPTDTLPTISGQGMSKDSVEALEGIEHHPAIQDHITAGNELLTIDLNLYNFIIGEMHNVQHRFTCTFFALFITSAIAAMAFQYLWVIDTLVALGPLMFPISSTMIALTLPAVYALISPEARYQPMNVENRGIIRNLIHEYYQREGYETTGFATPGI